MKKYFLIFGALFFSLTMFSQFRNTTPEWTTKWVNVPGIDKEEAGLYLFRKTFKLNEVPSSFRVKISGDNKYKLYVNEEFVINGPALGDLSHWNYETVDLTPYLKEGENIIASEVWNEGSMKPVNQFSYQTGFILQAEDEVATIINADETWKCIQDESYNPLKQQVPGYYAAGAGQFVQMNKSIPSGWKQFQYDDSQWKYATMIFRETQRGMGFLSRKGWKLQPSIIPNMELKKERLKKVRRTSGVETPKEFPSKEKAFEIPANTKASILLDQEYLTNAFVTLQFSKGKDANINLRYAEGLYGEDRNKGNRNEVESKKFIGRLDSIISNGSKNQEFSSLSYRTYRYLQLDVETKSEALTIDDLFGTFVGYPFKMNAQLHVDNHEMDQILEIGWRTARLCSVDTYMDCPFYERLQYVGDTRIQMFVSYFNSGDDRLAKNAINLIDQSRQADGFTLSRYPDVQNQVIPTYSLWHISTLYDYHLYGKDPNFVKSKILGSRQILNYFLSFVDKDGSLKNVPGWNYSDWVPEWRMGTGPMSEDGSSALLDLQLLHALQSAIKIEEHTGGVEFVKLYSSYIDQLIQTINTKYWDESRGLYADTPEKDKFSQHTNSLAILAGIVNQEKKYQMGQMMLNDTSLAPASIYFSYYLHLALAEAGLGSEYLNWLDIWRKNIDLGLTTWGETSQVETTRSDCHAWGSSPNVEFFRIILGIQSNGPQFSSVLIKPNIDSFDDISGSIPHPNGFIEVAYKKKKGVLKATFSLPANTSGTFIWKNKEYKLNEGTNSLSI